MGSIVSVSERVRVRAAAGTAGASRGAQPAGTYGTVIDGPVDAQGYRWWKIDYENGVDGWSVENFLKTDTPLIAPGIVPQAHASELVKTVDRVKVRAAAGTSAIGLGVQPRGVRGTLLEGPVEANGHRWWKIDYENGVDGWSADVGLSF